MTKVNDDSPMAPSTPTTPGSQAQAEKTVKTDVPIMEHGGWAVDQIVAWRGGAANRAALVKWCGFDPDTGEPWEDSWEPRGNLTRDLRSGGLLRRRRARDDQQRSQQEDQQQRQRVVGSRKSPRLAGDVPGRAMGELYRPWSCIVLCTGILGGWYLGVGRGAARRCFKLS